MKKFAAALMLSTFTFAAAHAQDAGVKDLDGDGMISQAEYAEANAGRSGFKVWDKNNDGAIDSTESAAGAEMNDRLAGYDADADGNVSDEEYNTGEFGFYDADGDGNLNEEEAGALNQARINEQSTPSE